MSLCGVLFVGAPGAVGGGGGGTTAFGGPVLGFELLTAHLLVLSVLATNIGGD